MSDRYQPEDQLEKLRDQLEGAKAALNELSNRVTELEQRLFRINNRYQARLTKTQIARHMHKRNSSKGPVS